MVKACSLTQRADLRSQVANSAAWIIIMQGWTESSRLMHCHRDGEHLHRREAEGLGDSVEVQQAGSVLLSSTFGPG